MTALGISFGFLQNLSANSAKSIQNPIIQVLGFEVSEYNPKQIILRISDERCFVDCVLSGLYGIHNGIITSLQNSHPSFILQKYDLVCLNDYFCKIDHSKMTKLKIIIRKLSVVQNLKNFLGKPEELSQFLDNSGKEEITQQFNTLNISKNGSLLSIKEKTSQRQKLHDFNKKIEGSQQAPIKIEEIDDIEENNRFAVNNSRLPPPKQTIQLKGKSFIQTEDEPLSLYDIMNNKPGFFIGRLLRIKYGIKEAKDGPMTFLYLGFVDKNGELVRINIAGRTAIKQVKELKKHKCYFIKGLQLFQADKAKSIQQIKLKEKDYKIHEIQNQQICSRFADKFYHWDHEYEKIQNENVDVIGIIEDIQSKITYNKINSFQEDRAVVRVIIRNVYKTVKISFWADQMKSLESFHLIKKQAVLFEDIKKKKSIFLDFTPQSNLIFLDEDPELKNQFLDLLPPVSELPEPENIKQLQEIYELEPNNTKIRSLNLILSKFQEGRIIYKMCNDCKRKVQRNILSCPECRGNSFVHKYNCQIEFADGFGSISCVAFDPISQKLFHKTANELSLLSDKQVQEMCEQLMFQEYKVGIQNKNNRILIRSMEKLVGLIVKQKIEESLRKIAQIKNSKDWLLLM